MGMFFSVLVANRGEIACRIIRTLRAMGIRSVAVYSDADRSARHVAEADVALRIGPARAAESYLSIPAVIEAAQRAGAEAIHPGYGFLSENPPFAVACEEAGIIFVGPGAEAIELMGDKIRAKEHVAGLGVPVIPGVNEPGMGDDRLTAAAAELGFPVLVKPSAGGGGMGMQIVRDAGGLPDALATARRVAAAAFGDDTLFLERLISPARHIEVQVLADAHGGVVHLGERECSLQRRHQKVVEEAPSPAVGDGRMRARLGEAACAIARGVGYRGAGTIEFLVPADGPERFYFMEMNTRLQVEHPVTEAVTGIDLVEWQLRIAAGEPLGTVQGSIAQGETRLEGHAIEARVYAEDAARGFLPSTGTVLAWREPAGEGVRVDSGIREGSQVTADYDPMLAKVIARGRDRDEALARLDAALAGTVILGVPSNIGYLRSLLADADVRTGGLDTGLIERHLETWHAPEPAPRLLAAAALAAHESRWHGDLWRRPSGWRLGAPAPVRYRLETPAGASEVLVEGPPERARVVVDGTEYSGGIHRERGLLSLDFDGETSSLSFARSADRLWLGHEGISAAFTLAGDRGRLRTGGRATADDGPDIRSPMPGTVVALSVAEGAAVGAGEVVATVEAMKMEHRLRSSRPGTVSFAVKKGDVVRLDQLIATVAQIDAVAEVDENEPTRSAIGGGS